MQFTQVSAAILLCDVLSYCSQTEHKVKKGHPLCVFFQVRGELLGLQVLQEEMEDLDQMEEQVGTTSNAPSYIMFLIQKFKTTWFVKILNFEKNRLVK